MWHCSISVRVPNFRLITHETTCIKYRDYTMMFPDLSRWHTHTKMRFYMCHWCAIEVRSWGEYVIKIGKAHLLCNTIFRPINLKPKHEFDALRWIKFFDSIKAHFSIVVSITIIMLILHHSNVPFGWIHEYVHDSCFFMRLMIELRDWRWRLMKYFMGI